MYSRVPNNRGVVIIGESGGNGVSKLIGECGIKGEGGKSDKTIRQKV